MEEGSEMGSRLRGSKRGEREQELREEVVVEGMGVGMGGGRLASRPYQMGREGWASAFGDFWELPGLPHRHPNYPHLNPLPGWERR